MNINYSQIYDDDSYYSFTIDGWPFDQWATGDLHKEDEDIGGGFTASFRNPDPDDEYDLRETKPTKDEAVIAVMKLYVGRSASYVEGLKIRRKRAEEHLKKIRELVSGT